MGGISATSNYRILTGRGMGGLLDDIDELLGDDEETEEVGGDPTQPGAIVPKDVGVGINTVFPNDAFVVALQTPGLHRGECSQRRSPAGRVGQFASYAKTSFWLKPTEANCQGVGPIWGSSGAGGSLSKPPSPPASTGGGSSYVPPAPPKTSIAPTTLPAPVAVPIPSAEWHPPFLVVGVAVALATASYFVFKRLGSGS